MEKKVVLVTGSSRGIGRACIIEFAKKGYNVVITYNNSEDKAKELEKEVTEKYDIEALCIKCDMEKIYEIQQTVEKSVDKFGKIDILVNNAGIEINCPFEEKTFDTWEKTFKTNLFGAFWMSKCVSSYMLDNKYGKIINVSSTSGLDSYTPFSMEYNSSKAALLSLTHDLAIQLQPYVNVNAVAPGWVDTEMNKDLPKEFMEDELKKISVGYIAKPEEIAKVITFLASDDARYINSEVIKIDGGYIK